MAIRVRCSNAACGKWLNVPDAYLGQVVPCPACLAAVEVLAEPAEDVLDPQRTKIGPPTGITIEHDLPARVGRFRIRALLGAGAYGTVYRAFDPHLDREVALKVPNANTLRDSKAIARFRREAKAAAKLNHPHIVPVLDAGVDDGRYFIASAFVPGRTLKEIIPEGGLEPWLAVRLTLQLCEALTYAHGQNVLHRDVKPANILLDEQGLLYLMDFGLAGWADQDGSRLTQTGSLLGTPAYMAPEQAKGETGRIGPWSDQYGAGVVLYEMLTGAVPFDGPAYGIMYEIVHHPPPPPSRHRPDLDPRLEEICLRALAKQPEDRYPSCLELATTLYAWLREQPVQARPLAGAVRQAANALPRAFTNGVGMKMILIPAGTFLMGARDDEADRMADQRPQHLVRITRPFYLSAHPITQEQFERMMGTNPSRFAGTGRYKNRVIGLDTTALPVENVTWDEAAAFCQRLTELPDEQRVGRIYQLPTEAEWEYACRAGTTARFCFGDNAAELGGYAWYCENSNGIPHPVGQKKPNVFGLYDMHGNVWEWCADHYDENYYRNSPQEDPPGPASGHGRVLRGGSWNFSAATCRAALRDHDAAGNRSDNNGFRVLARVDLRGG